MPGLEVRAVPPSEALTFSRVAELVFGNVATDEELEETAAHVFDPEWAIGVYDGSQLVATAGVNIMELTLPAGPGQPFAVAAVPGVTAVGVLPTHRRQGLLNRMMAYQFGQFRERELPLAILTASEAVIYGRYGYGIAASCQSLNIASKRSGFLDAVGEGEGPGPGRLRLVSAEEAATTVPAVHEQARRLRPGEVNRSKEVWKSAFRDSARYRRGAGTRMYVVHDGADRTTDGYASYRWKWQDGLTGASISVDDIYSLSPSVHTALWRFLLDIDLVEEVNVRSRPLDEPLRWRLADPRQLRTTRITDCLWARLVDVPVALATRGYSAETELVLEIEGPAPERFTLTTAPSGGSCRPARGSEHTDLVLGLSQLGAIFLGGCRPSVLAAAGRVREGRPGGLARADAAFASPLIPYCGTHF